MNATLLPLLMLAGCVPAADDAPDDGLPVERGAQTDRATPDSADEQPVDADPGWCNAADE